MPTYEYRCADCGHTFDIVQAFTDDSLTVCPECGGRLKKVFGNVGISFKGSGFYVNDSGSKKSTTSIASPDAAGSSSDGDGTSAGESSSSEVSTNGSGPSSTKSDTATSSDSSKSASTATSSSTD